MAAFAPTTKDRLSIIWPGHVNVDQEASDLQGYVETLDPTKLVCTGDVPTYHLRPLTTREHAIVMAGHRGSLEVEAVAYDILAVALVEITGPHPMTAAEVSRAKVRIGGLMRIPDVSPLWEDMDRCHPACVADVGYLYLLHSDGVTVTEKNS